MVKPLLIVQVSCKDELFIFHIRSQLVKAGLTVYLAQYNRHVKEDNYDPYNNEEIWADDPIIYLYRESLCIKINGLLSTNSSMISYSNPRLIAETLKLLNDQ